MKIFSAQEVNMSVDEHPQFDSLVDAMMFQSETEARIRVEERESFLADALVRAFQKELRTYHSR